MKSEVCKTCGHDVGALRILLDALQQQGGVISKEAAVIAAELGFDLLEPPVLNISSVRPTVAAVRFDGRSAPRFELYVQTVDVHHEQSYPYERGSSRVTITLTGWSIPEKK